MGTIRDGNGKLPDDDEWVSFPIPMPAIYPEQNKNCSSLWVEAFKESLGIDTGIDWSKYKQFYQSKNIDYSNPEKVFFDIYKQDGTLREEDNMNFDHINDKTTKIPFPTCELPKAPDVKKEKRTQIFENNELTLEKRGDSYFLSFFDENGKFRREVIIRLYDDYKVTTSNCK